MLRMNEDSGHCFALIWGGVLAVVAGFITMLVTTAIIGFLLGDVYSVPNSWQLFALALGIIVFIAVYVWAFRHCR